MADVSTINNNVKKDNVPRYGTAQINHTLNHPKLPQLEPQPSANREDINVGSKDVVDNKKEEDSNYSFVVVADTQLGMTRNNASWDEEMEYSRQAVAYMNQMENRPLFCCVCGDLVHMSAELYATQDDHDHGVKEGNSNDDDDYKNNKNPMKSSKWTRQDCDEIQDRQFSDSQTIWSELHPDIALVCVCGNHDVGDRPTPTSIQRFRTNFGDDYLAFWAKQSYNIVVNTSLFNDKTGAPEYYDEQFAWLEERLNYAVNKQARHIFVFGHHPWFLYNEEEDEAEMTGYSPFPPGIPGRTYDSYFVIPLTVRQKVMDLFAKYNVVAAFAGHFHQNMVSTTRFGMQMIVTGPLSVVLQSTGIPKDFDEPNTRGLRIVNVNGDNKTFDHKFVSI